MVYIKNLNSTQVVALPGLKKRLKRVIRVSIFGIYHFRDEMFNFLFGIWILKSKKCQIIRFFYSKGILSTIHTIDNEIWQEENRLHYKVDFPLGKKQSFWTLVKVNWLE